jgi:DNA polymerase-1
VTELVFDIETDGLVPTRIWCVVVQEFGTEVQHVFTTKEAFGEYVQQNMEAIWYAHSGFGFDYRVLGDLWDIDIPSANRRDTLVLSRLASPSRSGGHGLSNWGNLFGYPKGDHDEWHTYSKEMLDYCKRDVQLTCRVLRQLKKELEGYAPESIQLEHDVARIIQGQIRNGWLLDEGKCFTLLAELKEKKYELEETVRQTFRPFAKAIREVAPKVKKDGTYSTVGLKYLGDDCLRVVGGPHTRIEFPEFNLGSRKQIGEYLMRFGWKPCTFTEHGQPIVDEAVLSKVKGIPEAALVAEFLMLQKRIAQVQSWVEAADSEGRVHGYVNSNGAVTGRMTHSSPNVAQVPASNAPYGAECRSCWIVPEGYKLVGCDASGLELRLLAHYMNDEQYTKTVTEGEQENGTDAHTVNQQAAGLATRDQAKTFIYAFLYGAGDEKIGSIVGRDREAGRALKAKFLRNTPALAALRERVSEAAKRGWLRGLDGRRIQVRSSHAALNTLLQGAGAVIMKKALVNLDRMATAHKLDYKFVGNIHDEFQAEVKESDAESFGKLAAYAIAKAGNDFKLNCPMAGEYKIGNNWAETH